MEVEGEKGVGIIGLNPLPESQLRNPSDMQ